MRCPPFYLDPTEVRAGDYLAWLTRNGEVKDVKLPTNPDMPATNVSWSHAASYAEAMGKRLPDEIEFEFAATGGGRWQLPWGEAEEPLTRMPWVIRPVGQWEPDVVRIPGQRLAVYGLHSGPAEWTGTWGPSMQLGASRIASSQLRVVRGAPMEAVEGKSLGGLSSKFDARQLYYLNGDHMTGFDLPGLSFRCARSTGPRLKPVDFIRRVRAGEAPAD
ncbi:MAG: SUMF1/EgtB/PvdO family nonheme iron enzyme [Gemmataceae bacterium]